MRTIWFAALISASLFALPAVARPLGKAEAQKLDRAMRAYLRAIETGDAQGVIAAMPPRVVSIFAAATGLEEKALRTTLVAQTDALMRTTTVRDLAADQSALDAVDETLADGTTVVWVIVPTVFVSEAGGKIARNEQPLLALREGKAWHFLRIDGRERREVAALAYPFLAGQTFPEARTTPLE